MAIAQKILVGTFTEAQLKNKEDKKAVAAKSKETGLTYTRTKIVKHKGVQALRIWLIDNQSYFNSSQF